MSESHSQLATNLDEALRLRSEHEQLEVKCLVSLFHSTQVFLFFTDDVRLDQWSKDSDI